MTEFVEKDKDSNWYPVQIPNLNDLLIKVIYTGCGFKYCYALRKNIAYNLQYLEYLDRHISKGGMSSVVSMMCYKVFIVIGCSIVESLLHFLHVKKNLFKKNEWELEFTAKGNPTRKDGKLIKVDSQFYKKLPSPIMTELNFEKMINNAQNKKILGDSNPNIYPRLNYLRNLRNKIHLHFIEDPLDTDWNRFKRDDLCAMAEAIHSIFTSGIFRPKDEEKAYFDYLKKYF
ncbi:MAG: hypothetical protein E3J56_01440 [Candidatus Aminicenantes bacterium]|nr:MAG: hypothetical protein E3J56_01440 [Candidatus Aminicenantes bacterium]